MSQGWICVHRKLLEWEWFDDHNTFRLFMYFMLKANHKDKKWKGISIKRGQHLSSLDAICLGSGLTKSQVRTSIKKLKSTHEIAHESNKQHTVITVINYNLYQASDTHNDTQVTHESHANDTQVTPNNNVNNENNDKNKPKRFSPPGYQDVYKYFGEYALKNNFTINQDEPQKFVDYYESNGWKVGKNKMKCWKASSRNWMSKFKPEKPINGTKQSSSPRAFGE